MTNIDCLYHLGSNEAAANLFRPGVFQKLTHMYTVHMSQKMSYILLHLTSMQDFGRGTCLAKSGSPSPRLLDDGDAALTATELVDGVARLKGPVMKIDDQGKLLKAFCWRKAVKLVQNMNLHSFPSP